MTICSSCQPAVDLDVAYLFIFYRLDMTSQQPRDDKMFIWPLLIYQGEPIRRVRLALARPYTASQPARFTLALH